MFNFGEKEIYTPVDGELIMIDQVNDPVFATKAMGDGFAIKPTNGNFFAPIKGKVTSIFPTKHAISLVTKDGLEVLLHIGIDTVDLKGQGFNLLVEEGELVNKNTQIAEVDLNYLEEKGKETTTMIVFTNLNNQSLKIETGDFDAQSLVGVVK
ncbi:PTS glucose transporter subunit IIA [Enterococcus gilvus]|uniref:PTS sugar transporter subunit IIA n=1 Tax=Enterococcus gilvus TaxID=160453 RepID=UPI001C8C1736|nr:PTS glucose transporter subunit IIA [Enterococcus gilvus]MBX8937048.1 PTS glucose transporter subunit IIA [Enterococcus gilvus]